VAAKVGRSSPFFGNHSKTIYIQRSAILVQYVVVLNKELLEMDHQDDLPTQDQRQLEPEYGVWVSKQLRAHGDHTAQCMGPDK
jgi:hypothetical protein